MISRLFGLCVILLIGALVVAQDAKQKPMSATELRSAGDVASAKGEFKEAIRLFSKLIEVEPSPFHYFKRASVNLRQRKYADVIMDLNKALSMDPTFVKGLANRAKIHKMRGDCDLAKDDYNAILKLEPDNKSAGQELPSLDQCIANIRAGDHFFDQKDFHSARHYYSQAIEAAPESVKLLLKRAQCDEALGDFQNILVDTRRLLQNDESDLDALYVRGNAYYMIGEVEPALSHFRRGLKLDPEHKKLKARYKQIRAFTTQIFNGDEEFGQNKFADAIESYNAALELENNHPVLSTQLHLKLCKAYVKAKKGSLAVKACTHFLEKDEGNAEGFNYRGQAYMITEEYQQAVNDFQKATELSQQDGELRQRLQQAQLELKKAQRKNYYKILGVDKDASSGDIKKAFRALALKWHPDKNPKEEQEACEKMFRDIGEAYEVLSNEESRRKYDAGEDIQFEQGGGGHPGFQHFHGGFPFGGGGGQHFTFTFG